MRLGVSLAQSKGSLKAGRQISSLLLSMLLLRSPGHGDLVRNRLRKQGFLLAIYLETMCSPQRRHHREEGRVFVPIE